MNDTAALGGKLQFFKQSGRRACFERIHYIAPYGLKSDRHRRVHRHAPTHIGCGSGAHFELRDFDALSPVREKGGSTRFAVSHVLDLRLQRADNLLTADAALIETRRGVQIWAQRFETADGPGDQETLLYKMIRRIEPRLMQAMVADMQLPGSALSYAYLALVKALGHRVGLLRHDEQVKPSAIAAAEKDYKAAALLLAEGMACSPADNRLSVWGTALALAELAQGELDNALESATNACREYNRLYLPRLALAVVHLVREEQPQALAAVQKSLRTKPDLNQQEITCVLGERLGAVVWAIAQSIRHRIPCTPTTALCPYWTAPRIFCWRFLNYRYGLNGFEADDQLKIVHYAASSSLSAIPPDIPQYLTHEGFKLAVIHGRLPGQQFQSGKGHCDRQPAGIRNNASV